MPRTELCSLPPSATGSRSGLAQLFRPREVCAGLNWGQNGALSPGRGRGSLPTHITWVESGEALEVQGGDLKGEEGGFGAAFPLAAGLPAHSAVSPAGTSWLSSTGTCLWKSA